MTISTTDRDCANCVNDSICKGYRGDIPAIVCRDYEPADDECKEASDD